MYGSVSAFSESLVVIVLANVTPVCAGVSRLNSGGGGAAPRSQPDSRTTETSAPIERIRGGGMGREANVLSKVQISFSSMSALSSSRRSRVVVTLACATLLSSCGRVSQSNGEKLARVDCATCHMFPNPDLLDKKTWVSGVLPQMAPRLGLPALSLYEEMARSPYMTVLSRPVSAADWNAIVSYYETRAPAELPDQTLPAQPQLDPPFFSTGPFIRGLRSSAIITLLKTDSVNKRIFVGEAASNLLRIFDFNRRLKSTLRLGSAPTDVISDKDRIFVLASGNLAPNDEPTGSLVRYDVADDGALRRPTTVIDSLLRPVFVARYDFAGDGRPDYVICEFGNNRGRLALYRAARDGARYQRQVLDGSPGAIRVEIRDMTGDGAPDIVALLAQADERIVLFENDGAGRFGGRQRVLARFPPVYGSMYFTLADFNGDGKLDIVYVNGDNFDYSRVLKPYHGIRILENDGQNNFTERYFFPLYGAAHAVVADFDKDGDLDILATSNFADSRRHPERGILYLENLGHYRFRPYAFSIAAGSQWNVMATADLNRDGWPDVLIGAMRLKNITEIQRATGGRDDSPAVLLFETRPPAAKR